MSFSKKIIIVFVIIAAFTLPFFLDNFSLKAIPAFGSGEQARETSLAVPETETAYVLETLYQMIFLKEAVAAKLNQTDYTHLAAIAPTLKEAVVAIEDNRFYQHGALDFEGILRASLVNLQSGAVVEGGSTITQQLVKNLFLSQERSWLRKAAEIVLAVRVEASYSKAEILEMYLNTIYFGSGAYGVNRAARVYFDKTPATLDLAESALLAGLPNAPSLTSPYVNLAAAKRRQALVLDAMVRYKYLEPALAQEAKEAPLYLAQ
jgi:penicillin-binding protein 1A